MAGNFQNFTIKNIILFIYFGCAGSPLLCRLFSRCGEWGLLSTWGVQASHCGGFSSCGALALWDVGFSVCGMWAPRLQSPGSRAQVPQLWSIGLVALQHVGSSQTRDQTHLLHDQADPLWLSHREAQTCTFRFYLSDLPLEKPICRSGSNS